MDWNNIVTKLRERADGANTTAVKSRNYTRQEADYARGTVYADIADIIETEMRRTSCNAAVETQIESYR